MCPLYRFASVIAALAPLLATAAAAAEPTRVALVIGNAAYRELPAPAACPDAARAVAAALRDADFDVVQAVDASNGEMNAAILRTARRATPEAVAIAYYCGVAIEFDGRPFLVPVGAELDRPARILTEGIIASSLVGAIARARPRHGLVILDVVQPPDEAGFAMPDPPEGVSVVVSAGAAPAMPGALGAALAERLGAGAVELAELIAGFPAPSAGRTLTASAPPPDPVMLVAPPAPADLPPSLPADLPPSPPADWASPPPVEAASAPSADAPPPIAEPEAAETTAAEPDHAAQLSGTERRRIQERLRMLGYYKGAVDGIFGGGTRAAIRRYQREIGAAADGRLTAAQSARLLSGDIRPTGN